MTDYSPVSFNGEEITNEKLNKLSSNIQYLFERYPRMRYASNGITKDTGIKIITGRTAYGTSTTEYKDCIVNFGSYFTVGCKPIVVGVVEVYNGGQRKYITTRGLNGAEIDRNGFIAHVVAHEDPWNPQNIIVGGWVHWIAVGY